MHTFLVQSNKWLNKNMFIVVLSGMVLGYAIPLKSTPFLSALATGLFAYMTFMSALSTTLQDVVRVIKKPLIPLWSLLLIHGITPIVALGVGLWVYPDDFSMRVGLMIGSTIPIAVTSVIWTTIANGDIALALVTVTLDTLLIPVLIPTLFKIMLGTSITIDYGSLVLRLLLMVTIPSVLGIAVNELTKGRLDDFASSVGGVTSKLANFVVIFINSGIVLSTIQWNRSAFKMMLIVFGLVLINFIIGFMGSYVLKDRRREVVITMVFNVGMRNTNFGSVLAISYFPPSVALPIILILLFQQPLAAIITKLLNLNLKPTEIKNLG